MWQSHQLPCTRVSFGLCQQENTLNIALDTFRSLVSISEVRECVKQTLQILQISRDPQTRAPLMVIC